MRHASFARRRLLCTSVLALASTCALAVQTLVLPAWVCTLPDAVFIDGFEPGAIAIPHDPSAGSGGAYPGSPSRTLHIAGLGTGTQTYYLYLPSDYTPARSWPLLLALHGVAPYGSADSYASAIRGIWSYAAITGEFIVAAPVGNDVIYNNGQPYAVTWLARTSSGPSDYDLFAAIRADLEVAYNIERTRIYGWGFSAGADVMHDLGVNMHSTAFNASTMAAYAASAGDLAGLACKGLSDIDCDQALGALPRKIPVDIHIGTSDPNYTDAQNDYTRFLAQGWVDGQTIFYTTFPGGHEYTIAEVNQVWHNLCPNALVP